MIQHPLALLALFVAGVALLERLPLRFLPVPFWCYFLPMLGTTAGLLPAAHPLYTLLSQQLLPACLALLLLGTDLQGLARMGPLALWVMLAGCAGTVAGGLVSFFLYQRWLPPGSWGAVGALAGSWTGGSANMLAVKEALGVSDTLIGPLVIVDATIAYSWMALLIASSRWQNAWEQAILRPRGTPVAGRPLRGRLRSSSDLALAPVSEQGRTVPARSSDAGLTPRPLVGLLSILLAIFISLIAQRLGQLLPAMGSVVSGSTWTILLVTTIALALSLTPLRKLGEGGASRLGSFALLVLLASIGARANLRAVIAAPAFLALGLTWIAIHGAILLAAGWLLKAPLGLIATASQANVGGPISAPIVGATFSKPLASLGLLMAILGNILGTYLGLLTAMAARCFQK